VSDTPRFWDAPKLKNLAYKNQKPKTLRVNGHLGTLWIGPATATVHQKLMGNVPIMESVGKCVYYTKQLAEYATSPTWDQHNKN
jgi:hypothetical protein